MDSQDAALVDESDVPVEAWKSFTRVGCIIALAFCEVCPEVVTEGEGGRRRDGVPGGRGEGAKS